MLAFLIFFKFEKLNLTLTYYNYNGKNHSLSQPITLHHSVSHAITLYHSLSQPITLHHSLFFT
jgi:hypothetical protein